MKIAEHLTVQNFLTVKRFDWEIKEFNLLTGGMGTGKSICVKLLCFLERVLHRTIFLIPINKDTFRKDYFFRRISEEFERIFHSFSFSVTNLSNTEIKYEYTVDDAIFDLSACWDSSVNGLVWSSKYIDSHIEGWNKLWDKNNTPNMPQVVRTQIYEAISSEFANMFPIGTMFIPTLRAIASITDNTDFSDTFLVDFIKDLKQFVHKFNNLSDKIVNNILHVNDMRYDTEKGMRITLLDDREISPLELSSGQQELLYLLPLVNHLNATSFNFSGNTRSVFIEEPSAHLFPKEQKETIEFITKTFRSLKDNRTHPSRFFITTHSPYILNVMNTMMNRGRLKIYLKDANSDEIRYFKEGEVSAYAIDYIGNVSSMIPDGEFFLYPEKIEDIAIDITNEANEIDDRLSEFKAEGIL
jgi:predicted ATPase